MKMNYYEACFIPSQQFKMQSYSLQITKERYMVVNSSYYNYHNIFFFKFFWYLWRPQILIIFDILHFFNLITAVEDDVALFSN